MEQYLEAGRPEGSTELKYVVVYEETPTGWSAYVPDLPGCVAAGGTRDETEELIRGAIGLHVTALREDGEALPQPGTFTQMVEVHGS